jgi:hypothetical protein
VLESRLLLPKDRDVFADADNKDSKLQPIWQDSTNSLPRAPTISAPNFLVEKSPVSSLAVIPFWNFVGRQITKSQAYFG